MIGQNGQTLTCDLIVLETLMVNIRKPYLQYYMNIKIIVSVEIMVDQYLCRLKSCKFNQNNTFIDNNFMSKRT